MTDYAGFTFDKKTAKEIKLDLINYRLAINALKYCKRVIEFREGVNRFDALDKIEKVLNNYAKL